MSIIMLCGPVTQAGIYEDFKKALSEISRARDKPTSTPTREQYEEGIQRPYGQYQLWQLSLIPDETPRDGYVNLCPSCPGLYSLANSINHILRKLASTSKPGKDSEFLPEEIGALEALYVVSIQGESGKCQTNWLVPVGEDDSQWTFDETQAQILLSEEFSSGAIGAIHFVDDLTRIYIYRVKDKDNDKIIRIVIGPDGKAKVSFWRVVTTNNKPPDTRVVSVLERKLGTLARYRRDEGQHRYMRMQSGFLMTTRNGTPSDLKLLDLEARYRMFPGLQFDAQTMISAQSSFLSLEFNDGAGQEYFTLTANESTGVRASVPYHFELSDVVARGEVSSSPTNVSTRTDLKIDGVNAGRFISSYGYSSGNFAIEHQTRPLKGTVFSLRYENNESDAPAANRENTFWVRFGGTWD